MPISRLQLAAALMEYDNDSELASPSPNSQGEFTEYRDHRQSAIFQPYHQAQAEERKNKILSQPPPSLPSPLGSSFGLNQNQNRNSTPGDLGGITAVGEYEYKNDGGRPKSQNQSFRQSTIKDFNTFTPGSKSINLPNPYGSESGHGHEPPNQNQEEYIDDVGEDEGQGDLGDVDVDRWGLPSHLVLEEKPKPRPKSKLDTDTRRYNVNSNIPKPIASPIGSRVRSIHVQDVLDDTELHHQIMNQSGYNTNTNAGTESTERERRRNHSYDFTSNALASAARIREMVENQEKGRPSTVMGMNDHRRTRQLSDPRMIPLPQTPGSILGNRPLSSAAGAGWISPPPGRMDDDEELPYHRDGRAEEEEEEQLAGDEPNPFALPAPPPELGSRFDPKVLHNQRRSTSFDQTPTPAYIHGNERDNNGRSYSRSSGGRYLDDQPPFSAGSRRSTFHDAQRSHQHHDDYQEEEEGPLTSPLNQIREPEKVWEDIPTPEQFGRPLMPKRFSTSARLTLQKPITMLRPKTLIMPSLLSGRYSPPPRQPKLPEGYTMGEKPLPYGAKTEGERPVSHSQYNPLSLSQKTFRSSLMVNNQRDWEYFPQGGTEEEGELGIKAVELDKGAIERRPGKLFGRSLMDELEARKMAQKGKQRVFTGDSRPAMMARSTMYDPPTISFSPTSPPQPGTTANRPHSMHPGSRAPLLSFDSNGDLHPTSPTSPHNLGVPDHQGRISKSKSVFGVDQLWEKEMAKLKIMQEEERRAEENRRRIEEEKEMKKKRKSKLKGKGKERSKDDQRLSTLDIPNDDVPTEDVLGISPIQRTTDLPPAIQYSPEKARRKSAAYAEEEETEKEEQDKLKLGNLFSPNSDDEDGDHAPAPHEFAEVLNPAANDHHSDSDSDSDSEEDIPLSKLAPQKTTRGVGTTSARQSVFSGKEVELESESDSDEDIPLSRLSIIPKSPSITKPIGSLGLNLPTSPSNLSINRPGSTSTSNVKSPLSAEVDDEEAEDDLPLAVRQARSKGLKPITKAEIIEDDLPLGYKHSEKAQQQRLERQRQLELDEQNRNSMMSFDNSYSHRNQSQSWMGMPQMYLQQQQPPQMNPYMNMGPYGAMGYNASMPNLNMHPQMGLNPIHMGMGMNMMHPQMNMNMGMNEFNPQMNNGNPGEAIDSWRKDVALAPVPTGSSNSNPSRVSGISGGA